MMRVSKRISIPLALAAGLALAWPAAARAEGLYFDGTPLVTSDGDVVHFDAPLFSSAATIVSFTYTGCTSICRVSDLVMEQVADAVQKEKLDVSILTVTINPIDDRPEKLKERQLELGDAPARKWLTGDPTDVVRVLSRLNMRVRNLADHQSYFLVVSRGGRQVTRLSETEPVSVLLKTAVSMAGTD